MVFIATLSELVSPHSTSSAFFKLVLFWHSTHYNYLIHQETNNFTGEDRSNFALMSPEKQERKCLCVPGIAVSVLGSAILESPGKHLLALL